MNNTLKFRVWCKGLSDNKHFSKPRWFKTGDCILNAYYMTFNLLLSDDNFVVQQFTGLFDNNGKEIFEGDILHYSFDGASYPKEARDLILTCKYDDQWGGYTFDCEEEECYWAEIRNHVVIIGNIFEPPTPSHDS